MSATRLTFLYPHLLRSARGRAQLAATQPQPWAAVCEGAANSAAASAAWVSRRGASGVRSRSKSSFAPRHGKAVSPADWEEQQKKQPEDEQQQQQPVVQPDEQPQAPPQKTAETTTTTTTTTAESQREPDTTIYAQAPPPPPEKTEGAVTEIASAVDTSASQTSSKAGAAAAESSQTGSAATSAEAAAASDTAADESNEAAEETDDEVRSRENREAAKQNGPLEAVLLMQPPEQVARQHPSMSPPPYVHHFDSYSLVKQLEEGGYSREQAVTSMKAIRKLLAKHLDVAQQSLVSKSDVENETYLFSAACSELSTEIKNNRRLQDEQVRQERTHLQHEVDILTQSLNQELLTLNDATRGMFNDRKMAAREEQKAVDSAIQKINYKISILLTSDAKTDIEGVRWVLIRRSVLGIIFMAILTLGTLRYATYVGQQRKLEAERKKKEEKEMRRNGGPKKDMIDGVEAVEILSAT